MAIRGGDNAPLSFYLLRPAFPALLFTFWGFFPNSLCQNDPFLTAVLALLLPAGFFFTAVLEAFFRGVFPAASAVILFSLSVAFTCKALSFFALSTAALISEFFFIMLSFGAALTAPCPLQTIHFLDTKIQLSGSRLSPGWLRGKGRQFGGRC